MAEWSKAADCKSADTVYEGSNPSPTTISYNEADLAQQVEHIHGKDGVSGSSPEVGSSEEIQGFGYMLKPCFCWVRMCAKASISQRPLR